MKMIELHCCKTDGNNCTIPGRKISISVQRIDWIYEVGIHCQIHTGTDTSDIFESYETVLQMLNEKGTTT